MSSLLTALKLILSDLASLETPTVAMSVAGVLVPIIAGLFGANFSPAVIGGYLGAIGLAAAILQKFVSGQVAAAQRSAKRAAKRKPRSGK